MEFCKRCKCSSCDCSVSQPSVVQAMEKTPISSRHISVLTINIPYCDFFNWYFLLKVPGPQILALFCLVYFLYYYLFSGPRWYSLIFHILLILSYKVSNFPPETRLAEDIITLIKVWGHSGMTEHSCPLTYCFITITNVR